MRNYTDKSRTKPADLDEAEIKMRFLSGQAAYTIMRAMGGDRFKEIKTLIANHGDEWLKEFSAIAPQSDDRKTVVRRIVMTPSGQRRIVPVSLPFNSMHRLALQEATRA